MVSVPPMKAALVLGSGGVLGGAFHAGVVKALYDVVGFDARDFQAIVGTSAGSISGALLGARLHPNDLYRRETGGTLSPAGATLLAAARARVASGYSGPRRSSMGWPVAPHLMWRSALSALAGDGSVSPGTALAGLAPRGTTPVEPIRALVDGLVSARPAGTWAWPGDPHISVCAVDLQSGRRTVFDGTQRGVSFGDAVAASCSVPSVFEPVVIGGRTYTDGGVHSSDNADVISGVRWDLVVVSSPMSIHDVGRLSGPWHPLRVMTRRQTDSEVARLDAAQSVVIRPGPDDLHTMGSNMLDGSKRAAVALAAYNTAATVFSKRLTEHGIKMK